LRFGFLIDRKEFNCSDFSIKTVPDYDEILNRFYESACVSNGWVYGPERKLNKSTNEKTKFKQRGPINCSSFYRMSATHEIMSSLTDEDHLRFLILGYGFLQGLYLTPEGYSYLGRVPYEPGKLNGLLLCGNDYISGMEKVNSFYESSKPEERNQMFASIHWFLIGQSYNFEWDRFDAQYKVLDGIYRLSGVKASFHAGRPVKLAKKYGIILPKWAELDSTGKKSELSKHRNELVHEARYGGHPIGYSYPSENYSLEFTSFNTKLIAAVLGIDMPYLKAEPENRCQWRWDIKTEQGASSGLPKASLILLMQKRATSGNR
jgi:hypothetical protein